MHRNLPLDLVPSMRAALRWPFPRVGAARRRAAAAAVLALFTLGAGAQTTLNFDNVASGSVIDTAYPGVVFSRVGGGSAHAASVGTAAASQPNIVTHAANGSAFHEGMAVLQAEFATAQQTVSIDVAALALPENLTQGTNRPWLQALDAAGNVVATAQFQGALPTGGARSAYQTLTVSQSGPTIKRVRFSVPNASGQPVIFGLFDNLTYGGAGGGTGTPTVYDDFEFRRWDVALEGSGITLAQRAGKLEIVIPANAAGASISARALSTCQLRGDFDLRVDWQLPSFVARSGVRLGLLVPDQAHIERTGLSTTDFYTAGDYYISAVAGYFAGFVPTTQTSGKLRITRTGTLYRTWFRNPSNQWQMVNEGHGSGADVPFALQVWTGNAVFVDRKVTVRFDNVVVQSGQVVGTGCP